MTTLIAVQMNGEANLENNLCKVERLVQQACKKADERSSSQHKLVVLPECFSVFGVSGQQMLSHAKHAPRIALRLSALAKQCCCYIVAGTTPMTEAGDTGHSTKYYAASAVYSPSGKCIARYNKIHLFDVEVEDATKSYLESKYTLAGHHLSLFKTPFAEVAQSVCYDLRFPEMFSAYSRYTLSRGAPDIIVVPSAFTHKTGSAHWHALLKARSIENQCYIVAANQVGTHADNRQTFGNSCIYSPWGDCLDLIEVAEGFAMAEFDKAELESIRRKMPVSLHKQTTYTIAR